MFSLFRRKPATDTMSLSEQSVLDSLKQFADPNTGKDYVSSRAVKNLRVSGADVSFDIELGYPAQTQIDAIRQAAKGKEVTAEEIESKIVPMAVDAMKSGNIAVNPRVSRQQDIEALYRKAL